MRGKKGTEWDFEIDERWTSSAVMSPSQELGEIQYVSITCDVEGLLPVEQLVSGRHNTEQQHSLFVGTQEPGRGIHSFTYHSLSLNRHSSGKSRCRRTSSRTHCLMG